MSKSKTPPCNKGCGQRIWFDWNAKAGDPGRSDFGKLRPLQVSEEGELLNEVHDCPNSTYGKQPNTVSGNASVTSSTTNASMFQQTMNDILGKVERMGENLERLSHMAYATNESMIERMDKFDVDLNKLKNYIARLDDNPLDDDGDSSRESGEAEPGQA